MWQPSPHATTLLRGGGCVGCHQPPHSWRAGNQSLWCLISEDRQQGQLGGSQCHSRAPFEVLEQHLSGKADTSAAALGHSHQGCLCAGGISLSPTVSQQGLAVGGFVQTSPTHRWLCPGLIRSSAAPAPQRCTCWVWGWQKKAGRRSVVFFWLLGMSYLTGIWVSKLSCWLHPWQISADRTGFLSTPLIRIFFYPSSLSLHWLFLVLSGLFFPHPADTTSPMLSQT